MGTISFWSLLGPLLRSACLAACTSVACCLIYLLMLKHIVKHEHTLVRFVNQQLVLLAAQIGLTGVVQSRVTGVQPA
jgi:hypothetical protein